MLASPVVKYFWEHRELLSIRQLGRRLEVDIWYGQRNSCKLYVRGCAICNRQKEEEKIKGEQQLFHVGYTLEWVHIEIIGPLITTQNANRYILVIVDQFMKWVEAYPMKDQQGETVAKIVVGEFIAKFGCPLEIHTDQGRNFEGVLFKEMCALLGIKKDHQL